MLAMHHTSSSRRIALNSESVGEVVMGASAVLNFHAPMPSDATKAAAATEFDGSICKGMRDGSQEDLNASAERGPSEFPCGRRDTLA